MNIRTKLALRFSLIIAIILVIFSLSIYLLSENYRREEFFSRLESRALTTARLLVSVREVDNKLLRIIDKNTINALYQEKVLMFGQNNQVIYSSLDDFEVGYSNDLLDEIRKKGKVEYADGKNEFVGINYSDPSGSFVVIASAFDRYGRSKLNNLFRVLGVGLLIGILIAIISGVLFSRQVLEPLARINAQVSGITAGSLDKRVDEGNRRDEIAQLAMNFNKMLARISAAFEIQQQFVTNASHELRTPLTAITSQLQLLLAQQRSPEAYEKALHSLLDDARALVGLTNGLLNLAQSGIEKQRALFTPVRIDEVVFSAQNELSLAHPDYHFLVDYGFMPDEESALVISGNEPLLKTAFINLMDNGCKFSADHTIRIHFMADGHNIEISFEDRGVGIPKEEQARIFDPFYRGSNANSGIKGFGIGLSLCERIVGLHLGAISLNSTPGKGSCFKVRFPVKASA